VQSYHDLLKIPSPSNLFFVVQVYQTTQVGAAQWTTPIAFGICEAYPIATTTLEAMTWPQGLASEVKLYAYLEMTLDSQDIFMECLLELIQQSISRCGGEVATPLAADVILFNGGGKVLDVDDTPSIMSGGTGMLGDSGGGGSVAGSSSMTSSSSKKRSVMGQLFHKLSQPHSTSVNILNMMTTTMANITTPSKPPTATAMTATGVTGLNEISQWQLSIRRIVTSVT